MTFNEWRHNSSILYSFIQETSFNNYYSYVNLAFFRFSEKDQGFSISLLTLRCLWIPLERNPVTLI